MTSKTCECSYRYFFLFFFAWLCYEAVVWGLLNSADLVLIHVIHWSTRVPIHLIPGTDNLTSVHIHHTPVPINLTPALTDTSSQTTVPVDPSHLTPVLIHLTPVPIHLTPAPIHLTPVPTDLTPVPIYLTPVPTDFTPLPTDLTPVPIHLTPVPIHLTPVQIHLTPVPTDSS